jgi:hypothetical protein
MKKFIITIMALALIAALSINAFAALPSQFISVLDEEAEAEWSETITDMILLQYGNIYGFDNFEFEFVNERIENGNLIVDVNVTVDMTLTRHPSDSPFVVGMYDALSDISDDYEARLIEDEIDRYISETEVYYNSPEQSSFLYAIEIPTGTNQTASENNVGAQLYHRFDIVEGEQIRVATNANEAIEDVALVESKGRSAVTQLQTELSQNAGALTNGSTVYSMALNGFYDRIDARDWALDHATDAPEFNSANGTGSDCANFVSKALNNGGIPTENPAGTDWDWYPATTYGTFTAGRNWIRTGYNGNGGVVPYMVDYKGYFYLQTSTSQVFAGSIMYWTSTSHVALVTYGDGSTIKYTQHSSITLSAAEAKNVVYNPSTVSASFYMPETSIMV